MNPSFEELLKDMPKLELHIHLEGTFDLDTICMLAAKANEPLLRPKESLLQFDGLTDFLNLLDWICALVRERKMQRHLLFGMRNMPGRRECAIQKSSLIQVIGKILIFHSCCVEYWKDLMKQRMRGCQIAVCWYLYEESRIRKVQYRLLIGS